LKREPSKDFLEFIFLSVSHYYIFNAGGGI